jgi:glutamate N-acetyltransferase/amino-acid N-acetyltransferase
MPVNLTSPVAAQLLPVAGVSLGIACAGIKRAERKDLLVMQMSDGRTRHGRETASGARLWHTRLAG